MDGIYRISATDFRHLGQFKLVQTTLIDPDSFIHVQPKITLWGISLLGAIQAHPSQSHSSMPPTSNKNCYLILLGVIQAALIDPKFKFNSMDVIYVICHMSYIYIL